MKPSSPQFNQVRKARPALPIAPVRAPHVFNIDQAINDPRNRRIKDELVRQKEIFQPLKESQKRTKRQIKSARYLLFFLIFALLLNFTLMVVNIIGGNLSAFMQLGLVSLLIFSITMNRKSVSSLKNSLKQSQKLTDEFEKQAEDMVMAERKYKSAGI